MENRSMFCLSNCKWWLCIIETAIFIVDKVHPSPFEPMKNARIAWRFFFQIFFFVLWIMKTIYFCIRDLVKFLWFVTPDNKQINAISSKIRIQIYVVFIYLQNEKEYSGKIVTKLISVIHYIRKIAIQNANKLCPDRFNYYVVIEHIFKRGRMSLVFRAEKYILRMLDHLLDKFELNQLWFIYFQCNERQMSSKLVT